MLKKGRQWLTVAMVGAAATLTGCNRAVSDGVQIGVTDGLSDGLAEVIAAFITTTAPDPGDG